MDSESKTVVLQELEILEKFLQESSEEEIKDAANYILDRVKLNVDKLQTTQEESLAPRFLLVLNGVKKFLQQADTVHEGNTYSFEQVRKYFSKLNYKTYHNMMMDIKANVHKIPKDIDCVVGIPRSGLIPAYMVGLLLNKNVCSLDEFIAGTNNKNIITERVKLTSKVRKILVIDDSINTGRAQSIARQRIKTIDLDKRYQILYGAVYYVPGAQDKVDIAFTELASPRMFQWNYLNHSFLNNSCFDIDGLLCEDPTFEQNDDGEKYINFLLNAKPLYIPNHKIFALVTSRLEKYRPQTELWLKKNNVEYGHLIMLNLPSAEERRRMNVHAKFKAAVYTQLQNTVLFYESEQRQSIEIAELTCKAVFCTTTDEFFRSTEF